MVFGSMISDKELSQKFHQIIEQHKGILFKVAKTYCRNDDDRQDLLQEMMIQVWKSLPKYNDTFAITTWLYRICLNVAIILLFGIGLESAIIELSVVGNSLT